MNLYTLELGWRGAFVLVAANAQEAADKVNAAYPQGIHLNVHAKAKPVAAEYFIETPFDGIVVTSGGV